MLKQKRLEIIEAGNRLLNMGLIARTWGNISERLNSSCFIITPSGRDYTSLIPEEIVICNIADDKSWGIVPPSSEKAVHREIYNKRKDAECIIHTHQQGASLLAALHYSLDVDESLHNVFRHIPCAEYGFPGTIELAKYASRVVDTDTSALLMANHGAVCIGPDQETTLRIAGSLETASTMECRQRFEKFIGRPVGFNDNPFAYIIDHLGYELVDMVHPFCHSALEDGEIIFYDHDLMEPIDEDEMITPLERSLHEAIYKTRPDVGAIVHDLTPSIIAYSCLKNPIEAYLDDFAQINGFKMNNSDYWDVDGIVAAIGDNHGVFLDENGGLSLGKDLYDAETHGIVAEKNAYCYLFGQLFDDQQLYTVPIEEAKKMRSFYLNHYSKLFKDKFTD